jgi:hypothetical protein
MLARIPWWGWVIIVLILIGLFPHLYHNLLNLTGNGIQTVCSSCSPRG